MRNRCDELVAETGPAMQEVGETQRKSKKKSKSDQSSPFLNADWNSGIVTIGKGKRKKVLDFESVNSAQRKEQS